MAEPSVVSLSTFFAVFEALPRQGPGSRACTARALALCEGLPPAPEIVDLGCGAGAQTVDLAELTGGTVVAVDSHAPFARLLAARAADLGLTGRVRPVVADMTDTGLPDACADLVWSEGALYNIGLDAAFELIRRLLRPDGYLAFTDAVWRTDDPPSPAREAFAEYPTMGTVQDVLDRLVAHGYEVLDHFPLPESAWRDEFYAPMRTRIAELRAATPASDTDALAVLDACDAEIDLFDEHGDTYGYEFFVAR
jgi:SAM-dependent methyltransferase